ncbi:hypothetical protein CLF_100659 [Clonorchis sinensis]|uniref:Uncharacterized protein n=1 Tax=Clonorchis sinensis TaxID=79923 RepID=G7Y3Y5_CLOSI|nr:hypothetical protein CLF_100659 [Clonorchis sinensis]
MEKQLVFIYRGALDSIAHNLSLCHSFRFILLRRRFSNSTEIIIFRASILSHILEVDSLENFILEQHSHIYNWNKLFGINQLEKFETD